MKNLKSYLNRIENKFEHMRQTKWMKGIRITSGVTWNLFLIFMTFGIALMVFGAAVGAGYFASLVAKEPLRSKEEMRNAILNYEETSEIYLANNVYLGKVNADIERKEIKLEDVSPHVINAVLATEDEYFNTHPGIVPKAVFRGVFQDVTNSESQTGGSTLTQQLIKLQILTNEVSYERKAKEILLAMRLEKFMEKDEILEAYLNVIPYGRNANGDNIAGIAAAAEGIFNVKPKDLNIPQAAFISGIPQAPFAYTPFYNQGRGLKEKEHLQPGINRMKTVLFRMKETGYLTEQEYEEAIAYDITKDFRERMPRANERYPYLTQEIQNRTVDILTELLAKEDGITPDRLEADKNLREKYQIIARRDMTTKGYRIHSTIQKELYDALNEVAQNFEHYGYTYTEKSKDEETGEEIITKEPVQVGSIVIENSTGKILSFVGGRDYDTLKFNFATQAFRQNGSTMKPLLVYAPAIEYGVIGAGSPVVDVKFDIDPPWNLSNFQSTQELGIISARQALATSQNLATARLYRDIIDRKPVSFLEKMNFSKLTDVDKEIYSLSIGAMQIGASVEENTNAFATFANGGKFIQSYMIERIEDMDGNIVFQHESEPVEVYSPQTSYIITDMLRDVTSYGTATTMKQNLNFNMDIAAKTGTTDDYVDAWLVGYNPNISLGLWLGYKEKKNLYPPSIRNAHLPPSTRVNLLFARLMNSVNATMPEVVGASDTFQRPDGVVSRSFCGISGLSPSQTCMEAGLVRSDLFNGNSYIPQETDDSIIAASYVQVKGTKYLALPNTPEEFIVEGGTGVSEEFIERILGPWGGDPSKLFPESSPFTSNIIAGDVFEADDLNPEPVQASLNGTKLSWTESISNDVIGYYVYQNDKKIAAIPDGDELAFDITDGAYTVRAVDITGLLSPPSNVIEFGDAEEDEDKDKDKDKDSSGDNQKDDDKDKDKDKDDGSGNNQNGTPGRDEEDEDEDDQNGNGNNDSGNGGNDSDGNEDTE